MALFTDGIRMSVRTIGYAACQVDLGGSTGLAHLSEAWCKQLAPNVVMILSNVDVKWYEGDVSCARLQGSACHVQSSRMFLALCGTMISVNWLVMQNNMG